MNQASHSMGDRPFFYLPQFTQPVPTVQVQMQLPNVQPRNMPSATVNANRRCDICNKVFSTPGNCSIHKKKHAADNEKVQCDDCGKNFSTPGNLAIHKVNIYWIWPIGGTFFFLKMQTLFFRFIHAIADPYGREGRSMRCNYSFYTFFT